MANRIHYPIFKAFTSAGALAAGYKLWTYEAGTTTPLTTYKTSAGAAGEAHTNPIILDSLGEEEVFVTEAVKLNLLDTDDAQVSGWPVDNIDPTTTTAAEVSYTPSGGVVATDVQDAIDELIVDIAAKADPDDVVDSGFGTMPSGSTMRGVIGLDASREDDNDIAFAVGICKNSTNEATIYSTSVVTKQKDAVWAAGDDAGGFLTGTADVAASASTIYLLVIMGDGSTGVDFAFIDIAEVADIATLVTGAGFTYYKVLGFLRTNAANTWSWFTQNGDYITHSIASEWVVSTGVTTTFGVVTHTDYIAEDYVELIEYGVQDATTNDMYASDDGTNTSFFVGRTAGTVGTSDEEAWGDDGSQKAGLKPYLSTRQFRSGINTLDLLIQGYKLKR